MYKIMYSRENNFENQLATDRLSLFANRGAQA